MKRLYIFGVGLVGVTVAIFFLSQGTSFDLSIFWGSITSLWSRTVTKLTATTSSDPYEKALDIIKGFETWSAKAYPDADGWSIAWGHFILPNDPYDSTSVISQAEGDALLEQDARTAQVCVANAVTVPLTVNQTAALISFSYNIGCTAFRNSSLLRLLNAGKYSDAAAQFPRWNKSGGEIIQALVDRRAEEMGIFNL